LPVFATITIEREGEEIEIEVFGEYRPAERGSRDRYGLPLEPDEPEELELTEAAHGFTLTREEEAQAIEALLAAATEPVFTPPY